MFRKLCSTFPSFRQVFINALDLANNSGDKLTTTYETQRVINVATAIFLDNYQPKQQNIKSVFQKINLTGIGGGILIYEALQGVRGSFYGMNRYETIRDCPKS